MNAPGDMPGVAPGTPASAPHSRRDRPTDNPPGFRLAISAYRSALDATPRRVEVDYPGFVRALTTFRPAEGVDDKRKLSAWSPAVLRPGARRANDNVEAVCAIVLDYDDGATLPTEALEPWRDWPAIIHSSWSNSDDETKFRLIVPLAEPVPAAAWRWVWVWAASRAAGKIDRACKDTSRLYFLPHAREGRPAFSLAHDPGGWLCAPDWRRAGPSAWGVAGRSDSALAAARRSSTARRTVSEATATQAAREALRNDPQARERWAAALGARTTSDRAYGVRCPSCGRPSVWFALRPDSWGGAACNHRNSCNWSGFLDQLGG